MKKYGRKVRGTSRFVGPVFYIVAVVRADGSSSQASHGGWTSFTGTDRDAVIEQARTMMQQWERNGNGPYRLVVGQITGVVKFPTNYTVEPLV